MKGFTGLIYHCDALEVKIFPVGKSKEIDWGNCIISSDNFDFFALKDTSETAGTSIPFIEYSKDDTYNIEPLILKETIRYTCKIYPTDLDCKTSVSSRDYNIHIRNENNKFLKIDRDEDDSISFQFINYLGKSAIHFDGPGGHHELPFEVVSNKFDYKEDYVNLTEDIAEKCASLLLDYASPTSLSFSYDPQKQYKTALEQFIFLRQFCYADNIESLFASIKRNPDKVLVKEDELKPFGTGVVSCKFFTNPFSYSRGWNDMGNGVYLPSEISVTHKFEDFDTPANRFIKFALNAFIEICETIINHVEADSVYYDEALTVKHTIEDIFHDSFFDDVNELTVMPINNQVLEKREGYAQIFKAFAMVDLALQINWEGKDEVYYGEAKNTALLYEYWLVFEIIEILKNLGAEFNFDIYKDTDINQMISLENGLVLSIKEGESSLLSASLREKNIAINFYYNRTFRKKDFDGTDYQGSYSRPFRPDYTISIFPSSYTEKQAIAAGEVSFIHFDAKYRVTDISSLFGKEIDDDKDIEKDLDEEKRQESINTYNRGDLLKMHTYNDAIRKTIGSYVLYPGAGNGIENFQVYDELLPGVGAFAIRPGDKEGTGERQIEDFIKQIIDFKANGSTRVFRSSYFENMIIASASEKTKIKPPAKEDLYMAGFLRNDYCEWLKHNHFIPENEFDSNFIKLDDGIYFYYHAIRDGYVYPLHKDISKATKFCASVTDFGTETDVTKYDYLPFVADIVSTELVSAEVLAERLQSMNNGNGYTPNKNFKAQFYYLVKLQNLKNRKITGDMIIKRDSGNLAISPYSPKVFMLMEDIKQ